MKILLISNMYPTKEMPFYGIFVKNIEQGLQKEGIEFTNRITISVRNKNIFHKLAAYFYFYFSIIYQGLFAKYDAIYVHFILHTAWPLLIVKILKPHTKIIVNIHGSDIKHNTHLNKLLRVFVRPILKKAILIVVPSSPFKKDIMEFVNVDEKSIFVSPSGGVSEIFYKKPNEELTNEDPIVIGYISKVIALKGWFVFAEALQILKEKGIPFKAIVGGHQENNAIDIIKESDIENEVEYVGIIEYKNLPKYYSKMDVFIFPTLMEESLGLVGVEAMACGVPVIASFVGGISDYLVDGENGFFFNKGNSVELASKIEQFYNLDNFEINKLKLSASNKAAEYKHQDVIQDLFKKFKEVV